jgi:hypothetical protein
VKAFLAIIAASLLASTSFASDYEEYVERGGYQVVVPVLSITLGKKAAAQSQGADFKRKYCELAQRGHGMPIGINKQLYAEAKAALGASKTRQMFLPVARANNAVRCYCTEGSARRKLKCG